MRTSRLRSTESHGVPRAWQPGTPERQERAERCRRWAAGEHVRCGVKIPDLPPPRLPCQAIGKALKQPRQLESQAEEAEGKLSLKLEGHITGERGWEARFSESRGSVGGNHKAQQPGKRTGKKERKRKNNPRTSIARSGLVGFACCIVSLKRRVNGVNIVYCDLWQFVQSELDYIVIARLTNSTDTSTSPASPSCRNIAISRDSNIGCGATGW